MHSVKRNEVWLWNIDVKWNGMKVEYDLWNGIKVEWDGVKVEWDGVKL